MQTYEANVCAEVNEWQSAQNIRQNFYRQQCCVISVIVVVVVKICVAVHIYQCFLTKPKHSKHAIWETAVRLVFS